MSDARARMHFDAAVQAHARGRRDEAIAQLRAGLAIDAADAVQWHNLATLLASARAPADAEQAYRRAISLQPQFAEAHNGLAELLARAGRIDEATESARRAVQLRADYPEALSNLASLLAAKLDNEQAWPLFERAIALRPQLLSARHSYANALFAAGEYERMRSVLEAIVQTWPRDAAAGANLATALRSLGRFDDALPHYETALALAPESARAYIRLNRGMCRLFTEDYQTGLPDFESRLELAPLNELCTDLASQRLRPKDDINGKTVLVLHEQGLGDSILMTRFIPMLSDRGARVIARVPRPLVGLFKSLRGIGGVIDPAAPIPAHDVHCPMMSLAHVLGMTKATLPATVPYLEAPQDSIERGKTRVAADGAKLRIGIAWRGSDANYRNRLKSVTLAHFAPLARAPGRVFYNLQFGPGSEELRTPPAGMRIIDPTAQLLDFSETAGLMMNLDLIIAIDTATVHLAGALGKEVWTLLDFASDWRWLWGRDESPWYPTMRLFRQPKLGDWESVFRFVGSELDRHSAGG